jgi:hypothetical protein
MVHQCAFTQVLRNPDDCFCVMLTTRPLQPASVVGAGASAAAGVAAAVDGPTNTLGQAAAHQQADGVAVVGAHKDEQRQGNNAGVVGSGASSNKRPAAPVTLFSGYVVHQQICDHLGPRLRNPLGGFSFKGLLHSLFGGGGGGGTQVASSSAPHRDAGHAAPSPQQHKHRVHMTGPGGLGRAEVAVARHDGEGGVWAVDQRSVGSTRQSPPEVMALQCALLLVSMPVHVLARHVLLHRE